MPRKNAKAKKRASKQAQEIQTEQELRRRLQQSIRDRQRAVAQSGPEARVLRGHGGYISDLAKTVIPDGTYSKLGAAAGAGLGRLLGSRVGLGGPASEVGQFAGRALGGFLAKLLGHGDYSLVTENTLARASAVVPEGTPIPRFASSEHSVRLSHVEYAGPVEVPVAPLPFSATTWDVSPVNSSLFTWLSKVAENFQLFRLEGAVLVYRSCTSPYSANPAMGTIALSQQIDPNATPYSSMSEVLNSAYAVGGRPDHDLFFALECDPSLRPMSTMYIRRPPGLGAVSDKRFTSMGQLQVSTEGLSGTAGTKLGDLYLTVDIVLMRPQLGPERAYGWVATNPSHGFAYNVPFGNDFTEDYRGVTFGGDLVVVEDDDSLSFTQDGDYFLMFYVLGTTITTSMTIGAITSPGTKTESGGYYLYKVNESFIAFIGLANVTAGQVFSFGNLTSGGGYTSLALYVSRVVPDTWFSHPQAGTGDAVNWYIAPRG